MPVTLLEWAVPTAILLCAVGFTSAHFMGFNTLQWGRTFGCLGVGYAIMLIEDSRFSPFKQIVEDAFILGGVILAGRAIHRRKNKQSQLYVDIAILLASTAMVAISVVLFASARLETFFVQLCCALVLWRAAISFSRLVATTSDRIILATFLFIALVLTGECILYIAAPDPGSTMGAWRTSVWGSLVQYTGLLGSIVLTFAVLIASSHDVIEKYRRHAHTDSLTGLLNRRGLETLLASTPGERFKGASTALIMTDIDNFKNINDCFGHPFGDLVLAKFSALLQRQCGSESCAVRLGGEEFLVLLPGTSLGKATTIADEIRLNFVAQRWVPNARFTTSMGVTVLKDGEPFLSALKRGDDLLYAAKKQGRNCTVASDLNDYARSAADPGNDDGAEARPARTGS